MRLAHLNPDLTRLRGCAGLRGGRDFCRFVALNGQKRLGKRLPLR